MAWKREDGVFSEPQLELEPMDTVAGKQKLFLILELQLVFLGNEQTFCKRMRYPLWTLDTHRGYGEVLSQCQSAKCLFWFAVR